MAAESGDEIVGEGRIVGASGLSLILVDDNPRFARAARLFLAQLEGVGRIEQACSLEEAARMAATSAPHLLIADAAVIGQTEETLRQFRRDHGGVRVLLLSMDASPQAHVASLSAGADRHLSKCEFGDRMPFVVLELLAE